MKQTQSNCQSKSINQAITLLQGNSKQENLKSRTTINRQNQKKTKQKQANKPKTRVNTKLRKANERESKKP
jgi:hypothetical protein